MPHRCLGDLICGDLAKCKGRDSHVATAIQPALNPEAHVENQAGKFDHVAPYRSMRLVPLFAGYFFGHPGGEAMHSAFRFVR